MIEKERTGVVFVHGVGSQRRSDTLLDFGTPLVDWLTRWYALRGHRVGVGRVTLGFNAVDAGAADGPPSLAFVHLPDNGELVLAEAWWAGSSRRPSVATMLRWSLLHFLDVIAQLARNTWQRIRRLFRRENDKTRPGWWVSIIDLLNCVFVLVLYVLGGVVGFAVLLCYTPIALLVPIPQVQNFVLVQMLQSFLRIQAGEFATYLDDELQSANMRRRVAAAVDAVAKQDCERVIVVAHSEGAVVSFGMLSDAFFAGAKHPARKVTKLITFGAGLNKSWLVKPELIRLHGPLFHNIHWLDIWSSFDPVPAGPLAPPRLRAADGSRDWARIYAPNADVRHDQRVPARTDPNPATDPRALPDPRQRADLTLLATASAVGPWWPESQQVTNEMDVLSDHGGYLRNDEQVLRRIAAEIDATYYLDSPFWSDGAVLPKEEYPGEQRFTDAVRESFKARRGRVATLALVRLLSIAFAVGLIFTRAGQLSGLLNAGGIAQAVLRAVFVLFGAPSSLGTDPPAPIMDFVGASFSLALAAVLVALPAIVLYVLAHSAWAIWDRHARQAGLHLPPAEPVRPKPGSVVPATRV